MLYTRNHSGSTPDLTLAYSPKCVEGEFLELCQNGVLGSSETASLPFEQHYSSTAMASISTSCPSMASMDTPNSVLAVPAIPDCCTAFHTDPRSARSPATT